MRDDDRDRATGARTPAFLERWTAGGASGTLPVDRAVRLGPGDFLLLFPARHSGDLARYHHQVQEHLRRCETRYPFVALHGRAAAAITRNRPLPVHEVMSAAHCSASEALTLLG